MAYRSAWLSLLASSVILTAPVVVRAQSADERALATALFKEGRRLMEEGSFERACEKFAESQRIDPGGGTLLNLANCYERVGKTASAWTEYGEALAQARRDNRDDRAQVAIERIHALEPSLSTLTVSVEDAGTQGLEVRLDGVGLRQASWGIAVPIDPGHHVVSASAPKKRAWTKDVEIGNAPRAALIAIPILKDEEPQTPSAPPPPVAMPVRVDAPVVSPPKGVSPLRDSTMIGSAIVGAAGIVVGTIYGLEAIADHRRADDACPAGRCTMAGASLAAHAGREADVSTISFAVGAGALAVATILYFTRPSHEAKATMTAHDGLTGLAIRF